MLTVSVPHSPKKLHALVAVGQSRAKEGDSHVRWSGAAEGAAALHGNKLIVCTDEVMGLDGHQTEAECEGGRAPVAPWLIVLPRESPGRPVLSH